MLEWQPKRAFWNFVNQRYGLPIPQSHRPRSCACRGFFVTLHTGLYLIENILVNDSGHSVENNHVAEFAFAYILAVGENTEDSVIIQCISPILNAASFHNSHNFRYLFSVVVKRENLFYDRGFAFVNPVLVVLVNIINERSTNAVSSRFQCVFGYSSAYLLQKFRRIILVITL